MDGSDVSRISAGFGMDFCRFYVTEATGAIDIVAH